MRAHPIQEESRISSALLPPIVESQSLSLANQPTTKEQLHTVADVLVQGLIEAGVEVFFGVPGGPLTPFFEALARRANTIQVVLAKHEGGAAFMANGYARASGRLGVCCTTSGPGASNALTAVASSTADSIPVLILTAQVASQNFGHGAAQDGSPQGIDMVQIYKAACKSSSMLAHPQRAQLWLQNAIRLALSGRPGPVHLSLPVDIARQAAIYQAGHARSQWRASHEA